MLTKLDTVLTLMEVGDWKKALKLASNFQRLGPHRTDIQRGYAALINPSFYEQIGHDPKTLYLDAISALKKRYRKAIIEQQRDIKLD